MASNQEREVVPPLPGDKELRDYSQIVQSNFALLFQDSHVHTPLTAVPASTAGSVGDIKIVIVGSNYYLYAKVSSTLWKGVQMTL